MRNDYRLFKFNRIVDLEIGAATFSRVAPMKILTDEVDNTPKMVSVKMLFTADLVFRVFDEFSNDAITKMPNGDLCVQAELPANENMLCSCLLTFADGVEVIEPRYIRVLLKSKIESMNKKYRT